MSTARDSVGGFWFWIPLLRLQTMKSAGVAGHIGWWVFVVCSFTRVMAGPWVSGPQQYSALEAVDSSFTEHNALATVALIALAVAVLAAIVQAVALRRPALGTAMIVAPLAGGALILWTLDRTGPGHSVQFSMPVVAVLILAGVAIRSVGPLLADRAG